MTAAPTYEDLFAGLLPHGRKLLVHLLTCNDCRQGIVPILLSEQLPGLIPGPEEWSEAPPEPQAELLGHLPEERAT